MTLKTADVKNTQAEGKGKPSFHYRSTQRMQQTLQICFLEHVFSYRIVE